VQEFERLGLFYLGRVFDAQSQKPTDELLLYESKDLLTHAVCVGMTGSGKTGLCICLLEEALIDGIPALVIDPKGDITNLALTFPQLRPADFVDWVNPDDAARKNLTREEFAQQQANLWEKGLADWGQQRERIERLRAAGDVAIYTPGSTAGLPLSVLKSFAAPSTEIVNDAELLRDQVQSTAGSLLGLLGIHSDPLHGRESILLSLILEAAWRQGQDLQLPDLVRRIQEPGIDRVGAIDLESFFPAKERFELSLRLNNLAASPGFEVWLQGEPLDIGSLLYTAKGKPRAAIVSIAHLNDSERMFVVTLLFKQVLAWMRTLPGTSSLRAVVYMDEVAGYFPPTANPPSKSPMLTLLKQGRAFGIGAVLATQNPVDLDYKGLSNAGTWFLGRLQTEQDKARVLDGLQGVAASSSMRFDRREMDRLLSSLSNRVFLMNNVHEDAPVVFQVRWALSYLRGPLARNEIQRLMAPRKSTDDGASPRHASGVGGSTGSTNAGSTVVRPVLPPSVREFFYPLRGPRLEGAVLYYQPAILATADIHYQQAKGGIDTTVQSSAIRTAVDGRLTEEWQWLESAVGERELDVSPIADARFEAVPSEANLARSYGSWQKEFCDTAYRHQRLAQLACPLLKIESSYGENERDFRIRIRDAARERRDVEVQRLQEKYASRAATLNDRIRRAEQAVSREQEQASQQRVQSWASLGANLLQAMLSGRKISAANISRAERSLRGMGRTRKEQQDVARAEENFEALQLQLKDLETQLRADTERLSAEFDPDRIPIERREVKPRKADITCRLIALVWLPVWRTADGGTVWAWK
jgi:hypothetical protein